MKDIYIHTVSIVYGVYQPLARDAKPGTIASDVKIRQHEITYLTGESAIQPSWPPLQKSPPQPLF
jgi:hypothetical protein